MSAMPELYARIPEAEHLLLARTAAAMCISKALLVRLLLGDSLRRYQSGQLVIELPVRSADEAPPAPAVG